MTKWYDWINEVLSGVGLTIGIDLASSKEILGLILVILNIIVLVVSMVLKIITWFKKAKEDGQITKDELEELQGIVDETSKQIDDHRKGD